ncbi:unnamed protein product [Parnassius mnemosyne]|uniref:Uncharacterized protein n=1 Tax=Parnassius mnemosyne TaxID=213953 RepID=A0AAV1LD41_9NEOP
MGNYQEKPVIVSQAQNTIENKVDNFQIWLYVIASFMGAIILYTIWMKFNKKFKNWLRHQVFMASVPMSGQNMGQMISASSASLQHAPAPAAAAAPFTGISVQPCASAH